MTDARSAIHAGERGAARLTELATFGARTDEGYRPDVRRLRIAHDVVADTLRALDRGRVPQRAERSHKGGERSAAYLCATLSAWSYSDAQTLCDVAYRMGFGAGARCHAVHVSNAALSIEARAFYLRTEGGQLALLAFSGPEPVNLFDWLTDFEQRPAPDLGKHGRLHGGFAASLMPLWDPVVRLTTEPETRAEHVLVTGHGLGGALAALAALGLAEFGHVAIRPPGQPRLAGVYTFGQPMLGDPEFADWAEGHIGHLTYRYVNGNDLLPRLPSRFEGEYRHFGMLHRDCEQGFRYRPPRAGAAGESPLSAALGALIAAVGYVHKRALPQLPLPALPTSRAAHRAAAYVALARKSVHPELAFP